MTTLGISIGLFLNSSNYSCLYSKLINQDARPLLLGQAKLDQEAGTLFKKIASIMASILSLIVNNPKKPWLISSRDLLFFETYKDNYLFTKFVKFTW